MRGFANVLAALAVIGLGYWAYHQNILTQQSIRDVERLQHDIGRARERLSVLRAEWAYLNRPDRLRELADLNFERLGLMPMTPDRFGRATQIAYPRPPEPVDAETLVENASTPDQQP